MEENKKETYYSQNRQRQLALAKEYRAKNKEKYKNYWASYYMLHKQELIKKRTEYAKNHKEEIYEKARTIYYPRHAAKKKQLREGNTVVETPVVVTPVVVTPEIELPRYQILVSKRDVTVTFD